MVRSERAERGALVFAEADDDGRAVAPELASVAEVVAPREVGPLGGGGRQVVRSELTLENPARRLQVGHGVVGAL